MTSDHHHGKAGFQRELMPQPAKHFADILGLRTPAAREVLGFEAVIVTVTAGNLTKGRALADADRCATSQGGAA